MSKSISEGRTLHNANIYSAQSGYFYNVILFNLFFRNRLSNVYGMSKALTSKEIIQYVNCSFNFFSLFRGIWWKLSLLSWNKRNLMMNSSQFQRHPEIWSTVSQSSFSMGLNMKVNSIKIKLESQSRRQTRVMKGFLDLNVLHFLTVHWCSEGKYTVPID